MRLPLSCLAILALAYLKTQGFDVKDLEDGLLGLMEGLRGDRAKAFVN
jgi:hypothetical protein